MYSAGQPGLFRSFLFRIGLPFLILAIVMGAALFLTTAHEQALTPGEKNLGVAALAMLFGVPTLVFGAISVVCLVISLATVGYGRLTSRSATTAPPAHPG